MTQLVENLPTVRESWVVSLGGEGPPGEEKGHPLQYSGLENPMEGGAWSVIGVRVTKTQTGLSD